MPSSQQQSAHAPVVDAKKLFSLAFSAGGVQAMIAVVGIFTIKIIAPLGSDVLAGVTAGQRLYFVIQAVLLGLNVGSMALIARSYGEQNLQQANAWMRLSLLLTTLITLVMGCLFWLFPAVLLRALGMEGNALAEAINYVEIVAYFGWLIGGYFIFAGALRASGYARIPLICGVVLNLSTLIITYILVVYDYRIAQHWAGNMALAGVIGNALGLVLMLYLKRERLHAMFVDCWTFQGSARLWAISYPAIFEQVIRQVSVIAFIWVVAHYGTAAFAAYGASIMLITISLVIGFGFSLATAVMVGQALGAGEAQLAQQVLRTSLQCSVVFMSVLGLLLGVYATEIAVWLVGDGEVAKYTAMLILFYAILQPVMAMDFVLTGALQGSGDTRWPMLSVILGHVIIRFGSAITLLHFNAPIEWVFATVFIDYIVKTALLAWRAYGRHWPMPHST